MSFPKVKEEEVERETGAFGWTEDAYEEFRRVSQEAREGLRGAARKLAADAGLSSLPARPEREPAARDGLKTPYPLHRSPGEGALEGPGGHQGT
ncbi:unnamed protein product [Arctogadus glacialis]